MSTKGYLIHTYEILDTEYDMLRMVAEDLRAQGKTYAADDVDDARKELFKAILGVKKSWKFLEDDHTAEQIKMDT